MSTTAEKGKISINTENIFPIIKKFLYSDHEIFLRELVSNAVDATQKIKRLAAIGEYQEELGDVTIEVSFDEKKKTITISDRGLGMTSEEIKKYINQIAFSGATEFVEKLKGEDAQDIIGKFGMGFYSAFMVSKKVEIHTRSYTEDDKSGWLWECDGSTEFSIKPKVKKDRGTDIILYVDKDSEEFINELRLKGILDKYGKFLPVSIKFGTTEEQVEDGQDDEGKPKFKSEKKDRIINNTNPLWTQAPSDLTDEDYLNFYKELYPMSEDPLFWIHLNVDYPFNLTGILYFPKIKNDFEMQRNKIQLYSRQVFITDEVKDVVPEFLMLLHGVIDSPDIPLNVSRSYLQSDSNVKKINSHITKKVGDKLGELYKNDRVSFENKWDDIGLFVKYGAISDEKFYEKAKNYILLKNTKDEYFTVDEYKEKTKDLQTDKDKNQVILYTTDSAKQHSYIQSAEKRDYDVLILDGVLDSHFINHMEQKVEKSSWKRVDSDTIDKLVQMDDQLESVLTDEQKAGIEEVFKSAINNPNATITVESMAEDDLPVIITLSEFMRRWKDMQKTGGGGGMAMFGEMPEQLNVAINGNHKVIQRILDAKKQAFKEKLAKQSYDLALLSQGMLEGAALTNFIRRSSDLITK